MSQFRWLTRVFSAGIAFSMAIPAAQANPGVTPSVSDVESVASGPEFQGEYPDKELVGPTNEELEEIYGAVEKAPVFLGGKESGTTTQSAYVDGVGEVSATLDNETGIITSVYPDGTVEEMAAEEAATQLYAVVADNRAVNHSDISLQASLDPFEVCPYVVSVIGAGGSLSFGAILAAIGINPIATVVLAMGQAVFMTWVANNC